MIPKQFRIHIVLIVAALFMIVFPMLSQKLDPEKKQKATAAAIEFLQLIDAGKYAQSWQVTADLMKNKMPEQEWVKKLSEARQHTGALVERQPKDASFSTTAKDSPDGEYISLTFAAKYQQADSVTEYVTVMLEDGNWKVAGYFVQ